MSPKLETLQGELSQTPLVEIIGRIYAEKCSGELLLKVKKAEYKIFFLNGIPVNAQSSLQSDHLFEFMVHLGLVDREDVPRLKKMVHEGLDSDRAILQMGLANSTQIYYLRQLLAREVIIRACGHREGKFHFNPREDFLDQMPLYDLSPLDIIYEAINRHHLHSLPEKIQKMAKAKIRLNPELKELENLPEIFYERTYLLDDFREEMPVERAISFLFNEFRELNQALNFLYVMIITGVFLVQEEKVEPVKKPEKPMTEKVIIAGLKPREKTEPPKDKTGTDYIYVQPRKQKSVQEKPGEAKAELRAKPMEPDNIESAPARTEVPETNIEPEEPIKPGEPGRTLDQKRKLELLETKIRNSGDYFQVLGVKPDARIAELEQAYHQLLKQFEIDEIIKSQDPELTPRAEEAKKEVIKIIKTLTNPEERNQYEKSIYKDELKRAWNLELRRLLARKQFERGKWYLEHNRPDYALERFEQAIELNPEVAEFYAYTGWALYRTGKGTRAEAEGYLKQAIRQNPRVDIAYYFLGLIAKRAKADNLAEEYLEKALAINPNNAFAQREMDSLQKHKKGNVFQKLFSLK